MSFSEAVVDTVYETSRHLMLKCESNRMPAACFATRPGGKMEDGRGGGREGGRKRGTVKEPWHGRRKRGKEDERRKGRREGARQGGGSKPEQEGVSEA